MINIVLYQPEIPENTGNIGRLCVGAKAFLHIIKPMKFIIDEKRVKRAGLDYWEKLKYRLYDSLEELIGENKEADFYYCTTKTKNIYTSYSFKKNDFFVFGPESRGLPIEILNKNEKKCLKIPMSEDIRSINLANSVAIIMYEAIRQISLD